MGGGEMGAGGEGYQPQQRFGVVSGELPHGFSSLSCRIPELPHGRRREAPARCGHGVITFQILSAPPVQATPALALVAGEMGRPCPAPCITSMRQK